MEAFPKPIGHNLAMAATPFIYPFNTNVLGTVMRALHSCATICVHLFSLSPSLHIFTQLLILLLSLPCNVVVVVFLIHNIRSPSCNHDKTCNDECNHQYNQPNEL